MRWKRSVAGTTGLPTTGRVKTMHTLQEKLRRGTQLSALQDLAGIRVVVPGRRSEQDTVVADVTAVLDGHGCPVRQYDRRQRPSAGYRAVHLVVTWDGCPVEVQVRTHSQHVWANAMERLADRVGRGVRYGERPDDSNDAAAVDALLTLADELDTAERADAAPSVLRDIEARIAALVDGANGTVTT